MNRVGFTVTTKLGKAVVRNRIRRRLREIYRLNEARLCRGADLVIVARTRSLEASYAVLEQDFLTGCAGWVSWREREADSEDAAAGSDPVLSAAHLPPHAAQLPVCAYLFPVRNRGH